MRMSTGCQSALCLGISMARSRKESHNSGRTNSGLSSDGRVSMADNVNSNLLGQTQSKTSITTKGGL